MQGGTLLLPFLGAFFLFMAITSGIAFKEYQWVSVASYVIGGLFWLVWLIKNSRKIQIFSKRKGTRHGLGQGVTVILGLLLAVGLSFLSQRDRFNKSFDVTKEGANTLSSESIKLIEEMKEKGWVIKILAFFQTEESKNEFNKILALYQMKGAKFEVEYIDPQTDPARAIAEQVTAPDTVIFKSEKHESKLNTFSEEKVTNAMVRVLKSKEHTVYFLTGHGESDINAQDALGYSAAKAELESQRFSVKSVNLLEAGKVPDDADLLIIAGPKYDIKAEEKGLIEAHLKSGKPLMVLVDALVAVPLLNELIASTGIKLNNDLLVIRPDDPRAKLLGQNNAIVTDFDRMSPVTAEYVKRGGVALMTPNTRTLDLLNDNTLKLKPSSLGKSSEIIVKIRDVGDSSDLKGGISADRLDSGSFTVFAAASGPIEGNDAANLTTSEQPSNENKIDVTAAPKKELRVFVGGSSHLATNLGAQRGENLDLFTNAINYLLQDEDFISIRAKDTEKSRLDLTSASSQFLMLGMTWIYPLMFVGAGIFYWLRRRNT